MAFWIEEAKPSARGSMLILLRGGPFGGTLVEDANPADVLIVNQKHFYKKTDRGELVEIEKNKETTAAIYEINFRMAEQPIQWELL